MVDNIPTSYVDAQTMALSTMEASLSHRSCSRWHEKQQKFKCPEVAPATSEKSEEEPTRGRHVLLRDHHVDATTGTHSLDNKSCEGHQHYIWTSKPIVGREPYATPFRPLPVHCRSIERLGDMEGTASSSEPRHDSHALMQWPDEAFTNHAKLHPSVHAPCNHSTRSRMIDTNSTIATIDRTFSSLAACCH